MPAVAIPARPQQVLITETDYKLPVATTPAKGECHEAQRVPPVIKDWTSDPPQRVKSKVLYKVYDFTAMPVVSVRRGPVIDERPYVGFDDDRQNERRLLFARSSEVTACWKWASARGTKETSVELQLTIDPSGATRNVRVTSADSQAAELSACVEDAFAPTIFSRQRARETQLSVELDFRLADEAAWKTQPKRPKPPAATKATKSAVALLCPPPTPGVVDDMRIPTPLMVTDSDRRRVSNARPQLDNTCDNWSNWRPYTKRDIDKSEIRTSVRSHLGALNGCYTDAIQRVPDVTGEIDVRLFLDQRGWVREVQVTGAGDPQLQACFAKELGRLWVHAVSAPVQIDANLIFTLTPPAPVSTDPDALIAASDTDGALAIWSAQLTAPHTALDGCRAHAGIVRAVSAAAPWLDDGRVFSAMTSFTRSVLSLPPDAAKACVAELEPALQNFARAGFNPPNRRVMRHVERLDAVLPLAPFLDWGIYLRWHHAAALLGTSRASEGLKELADLVGDPKIGVAVKQQLEQRSDGREWLVDPCGR